MNRKQLLFAGSALGLLLAVAAGSPFFSGAGSTQELIVTTNEVAVPAKTFPADVHEHKITARLTEGYLTVPEDGWITSFSQKINGAPEGALRFSWVYDESQTDPYCPSGPRVVFVMSFEKLPVMEFPPEHGYPVEKGDRIKIFGGFANFSDADYPAASLTARLGFVPRSSGRALQEAFPVFLNIECDSLYVVPPRATVTRRLPQPYTIPIEGRITLLGSHAHRFATNISLSLNGNTLWRTTPVSLSDGTNFGNPVYKVPFNGVPVKPGDTLDLAVTHANQLDRPTDAMGSMYIQILLSSKPDTLPPVW